MGQCQPRRVGPKVGGWVGQCQPRRVGPKVGGWGSASPGGWDPRWVGGAVPAQEGRRGVVGGDEKDLVIAVQVM